MNWSEWVLIFIAVGFVVTYLRSLRYRQNRDYLDAIAATFLWPISLLSYFPYKYKKIRDERRRQAHITQNVREGKYTAEWAHDHMTWKEPKGGV